MMSNFYQKTELSQNTPLHYVIGQTGVVNQVKAHEYQIFPNVFMGSNCTVISLIHY